MRHLGVGQKEVLQLEEKRFAVVFGPFNSGCKGRRRHGNVGVRLVIHVEEGGEGHVGELAVLAVWTDAEELLQALG